MKDIMDKRAIYFVLSTHWDREWYQPFQDYRYRLVDLVDEVLDGLKSGELKGAFYSDGQYCLWADYLEVRPERLGEIQSLLKSGKIVAGPWYGLPDEFLISGESTIRNIALGCKMVRAAGGEPSKAGFLCDMFGHISQMPQILNGFGVKAAFLWRGVDYQRRNAIWKGADGTTLPMFVFSDNGYGDYAINVRQAFDKHYEKFDKDKFRERLERYVQDECDKNDIEPILLFDGMDHNCWDRRAYREAFEMLSCDERFDFRHASLDEYMEAMLGDFDKVQTVFEGELRSVIGQSQKQNWLIPGVLSSRVDIKQANAYCENLLCNWAEPFSAFSNIITGIEYPQGFLDVAWKWLLENHPHDSICGCSVDQVHKDMEYRFSQTKQIGERLTIEAAKSIAAASDARVDNEKLKLVLFNPSPQELDEVVEVKLQIPQDWHNFEEFFGFEKLPAFRITDSEGGEIDYQRTGQKPNRKNLVVFRIKAPHTYQSTEVEVAFKVQIPALGYKTLLVQKAKEGEPVRHSSAVKIAHSGRCLENEHLKVEVNSNGTINICDKSSGEVYENLLSFEENADIGDGWYHGIAANDQVYHSSACASQVSVVSNGAELGKIKIRTVMMVPEEFDFALMRRSEKLKELVIESILTLKAGGDKLEIESFVDNNVCDHRLRAVFPSSAAAESFLADSLFDVVERKIALPADNYKNRELDVETRPQQSWTAVCDGKRGLAITSCGLYESTVADEPQKPIKLTLFRSTRHTVMTNDEPCGQLLKPLSFKYAIQTCYKEIDRLKLFADARKTASGVRYVQMRKEDVDIAETDVKVPAEQGFISVDGAVLTSAVIEGKACRIRFFNPLEKTAAATVNILCKKLAGEIKEAFICDFEDNRLEDIKIQDGKLSITAKAKQIITVKILRK